MNVHKMPSDATRSRAIVRQVEIGQTPKAVGEAAGVCRGCFVRVFGYRSEGLAGLRDRVRAHRLHRPTPQAVVTEVGRLRRQRYTGQQIAATALSPATSAASAAPRAQ